MLSAGLIDQLFLTLSPALAGRREPEDRLQLIEGAALMPDVTLSGELLSVRSDDGHLFLRYALTRPQSQSLPPSRVS
jgi:riboflavin biosynthesis pyrimidine reductase